ncbi:hypothetical protein BCV69DRAFT_315296 [Microstroma glucosiphilum]|uniref:Uncharacterized protein n=1 Tax=Pseudomicrostroma glucosiphilum TaxID=1684307 RepID=A0A316TY82_9BASI|nr:hypothetical protein BCV69DRAFT_315296 [Pseudomicrostroma glucosiphilum]PWN17694.1 hypothetical protein BCV69DRAFT_315296 [Pseudomicrostroma glucosiphilum]
MEVPNERPFFQSGDNLLWLRVWLRMQHFKRSGKLHSSRPVLSAGGSLLNHDKKKLNPPGQSGRYMLYWPDVKPGKKPKNGRSLRADLGIAETSRLRRRDEAAAANRARDRGDGGATAVDEDHPRASTPLTNGRRGRECSQASLDSRTPDLQAYECSRSDTADAEALSAEARMSDAPPMAVPAPEAATFKARTPYFARAQSTRLCKLRYEHLPEQEKARKSLYKPRDHSKTNPYRHFSPKQYAAALRASREKIVNDVEALSRKPDAELSAEKINDELWTLMREVAMIYPPMPYDKIKWAEDVSMDCDAFTVDPSFLCALQRLDTRLQLIAHNLGYEYEHQWPAKVCVCRVETLMLINICQVQDAAYEVMNYEADDAWLRPQTDDEKEREAAAAAVTGGTRSKSKSRKRKRRGARDRGECEEFLSECPDEEDQAWGDDDFAWHDAEAEGQAEVTTPSDPSIEIQRGGESGLWNEGASLISATWQNSGGGGGQRYFDLGTRTSMRTDGRRRPRLSAISVEVDEVSGDDGRGEVQVSDAQHAALFLQGQLWRHVCHGAVSTRDLTDGSE